MRAKMMAKVNKMMTVSSWLHQKSLPLHSLKLEEAVAVAAGVADAMNEGEDAGAAANVVIEEAIDAESAVA